MPCTVSLGDRETTLFKLLPFSILLLKQKLNTQPSLSKSSKAVYHIKTKTQALHRDLQHHIWSWPDPAAWPQLPPLPTSVSLSLSSSSTHSPSSCLRPSHRLLFSILFAWMSACFPPALSSAHFLMEVFPDLLTDRFDFSLRAGLPPLSTSSTGQGSVCLPHRCRGERGTPWALALQHCGRKEGTLENFRNHTSVHPRKIKC